MKIEFSQNVNRMRHRFQRASLAPDGFAVDSIKTVGEIVHILLRSRWPTGACPADDKADAFKADICDGPQTYPSVAVEYN
jgi:hypothetical protein